MNHYDTLHQALKEQCPEAAIAWLQKALNAIESEPEPEAKHQIASAMARRKMGEDPISLKLVLMGEEPKEISHWSCADIARILLNLALIDASDKPLASLLSEIYAQGDERERAALVMGLPILDPDAEWLVEAEDCCRTNSLLLFSAMAMHNPYPARHFSPRAFNQLVLKALFLGLDIAHTEDLQARYNSELSIMCADYIEERMAASRDYPASIWLAIRLQDCQPETADKLADCLTAEDTAKRYYAAVALRHEPELSESLQGVVKHQAEQETDVKVRAALMEIIESKGL